MTSVLDATRVLPVVVSEVGPDCELPPGLRICFHVECPNNLTRSLGLRHHSTRCKLDGIAATGPKLAPRARSKAKAEPAPVPAPEPEPTPPPPAASSVAGGMEHRPETEAIAVITEPAPPAPKRARRVTPASHLLESAPVPAPAPPPRAAPGGRLPAPGYARGEGERRLCARSNECNAVHFAATKRRADFAIHCPTDCPAFEPERISP